MKYILFIFLISTVSACTNKQQKLPKENKTVNLESFFGDCISMDTVNIPIVDFKKRYPQKTVTLQDIADVEYIRLETTDKSLIAGVYNVIITDSLIITYNLLIEDILFFHRDGTFSHSFKKKGNSGTEYTLISDLRVNPKTKEIYINDNHRKWIQVYSYKGDYKRTIKLKDKTYTMGAIYNYNDEHLFAEDWFNVDREGNPPTNPQPYYKISLTEGTMTRLPLIIKKRIRDRFKWNDDRGQSYSIGIILSPIAYINDELIIADYALDTVYTYRNDKLIPIAVRKNQFKKNDIPIITTMIAMTDKYFLWKCVEKDFKKTALPSMILLQSKYTGNCLQIKITDKNITDKNFEFRHDMSANQYTVPKNHVLQHYPAEKLIELNDAGKLKGELKEIASKLKVDDNPVLMLAKFKE